MIKILTENDIEQSYNPQSEKAQSGRAIAEALENIEVSGGGTGENGATFTPSVSSAGVISWTNDKGLPNPTSVNIKGQQGEKGDKGDKGEKGADGYTPIKGVDYFDGVDGINGSDGYTPIKGVDYYTEEDKAEYSQYIANELAKRGQIEPEYAQSIADCKDQTKMYVLPDGFIYAYMLTEKEIETGPSYTNKLLTATDVDRTTIYNGKGYKEYTKLSGSSGGESAETYGLCSTGFIFPVSSNDVLRIKGITPVTKSNHYVVAYNSSNTRTANMTLLFEADRWVDESANSSIKYTITDGIFEIPLNLLGSGFDAIRICAGIDENTIITINEEIKEGGGTKIITEYAWTSTGHAFVPADYEDRIIDLEEEVSQHSADIENLKKGITTSTPIKTWDAPIYDANIPVFELSTEKSAITSAEKTVESVYAKYDALMAKHPHYITKTNLGMCSDGVTPVYRYDFREPEPHRGTTGKKEWSETKTKAIIVSGIHWEWGGIFALYNALEEIADNPTLLNFRRNTHLIVLPVCNPYAVANQSVRNANQVEIHRNFEVDFIYPDEDGYIEIGERSHGGTSPLSEIETQYIDNIMKNNTDASVFLTCHSCQGDEVYGTSFIWSSPATYYMCNMAFRLIDKLSTAWMNKYSDKLLQGIAEYRTSNTPEWDTRLGMAYLSTTNGTETKQATKYGIQGTNVEITDAFLTHGTKSNPETALSSFTMSRGAEVYINFLLTALGTYDYKDKKEYAPTVVE